MDRFRLGRAMAFAIALAAGCGGNDAATTDPTSVQLLDGAVIETQCSVPALDTAACGVNEGLPYYGFYDGCNWCNCANGGVFCTLRACSDPDGGLSGGTVPFGPSDCDTTYFGVGSISLPEGENWVCDADGRIYRSTCAPAGVDGGNADAGMDSGTGGNPVNTIDGSVIAQCTASTFTATACGVFEGQPYYGYYDGCNWHSCVDGFDYHTQRLCVGDGGSPITVPFGPYDCNPIYFGVSSVSLPAGETWVCDAEGRLYRSVCAPAGVDGGI